MNKHIYGIKNKLTGKFFAGFSTSNEPLWTANKDNAWKHVIHAAKAQAILLAMSDTAVQKKPVFV